MTTDPEPEPTSTEPLTPNGDVPSGAASGVSTRDLIVDRYNTKQKPRTFETKIGPFTLRFNPVVSLVSILLIWGFVTAAIVAREDMNREMNNLKSWIRHKFTWLYVGAFNIWSVFVLIIYFSKYSSIRLGKDDEVPEYSDTSYFTMLFAAGIGPGMFYFSVSEPIAHYIGPNRHTLQNLTDNQLAQRAMDQTLLHWGVHGWCVYVLVGMLLALMSYRYDLNMTIRTCFFPLLGERVMGALGDVVDIFSVVCTMFGVCTTLGIGVMQLNRGLSRLIPAIEFGSSAQLVLIWSITIVATLSVVSGMKAGIKVLSLICYVIGLTIMCIVFLNGNTCFFLNSFVQNVGSYVNNIIALGTTTEAYSQVGNSRDGRDVEAWMDDWTVFYYGFWVSWSPFVGMFIAKISRGRTIRDYILYTLTIPFVYVFVWFTVFGGASIQMERTAAEAGLNCDRVTNWTTNITTMPFSRKGKIVMLSCQDSTEMLFDVVEQYDGLALFMTLITMLSLVLYFVTSSDSGSMVIDCLTANGADEPPTLQRIFWSFTEGATATALLVAGGTHALNALRSVAICAGLLYIVVVNFMCLALWRMLQMEAGDISPFTPVFFVDLIDPFYTKVTAEKLKTYICAVFAPWYQLSRIATFVWEGSRAYYAAIMGIPFALWILLLACSYFNPGLMYVAWTGYLGFVVYATGVRSSLRDEYDIIGNIVEDFFAMLLVYPLTVIQMDEQHRHVDPKQRTMTVRTTDGHEMDICTSSDVICDINTLFSGFGRKHEGRYPHPHPKLLKPRSKDSTDKSDPESVA